MNIAIQKVRPNAKIPAYQTSQSAAMDMHAAIEQPLSIKPMERVLIPCGFAIALPEGYEAQVRARSGLAIKHGLSLVNGIGTIDADYRGELQVIMINLSEEPYVIQPDERIAQLVVAKYEKITWEESAKLSESKRTGGFGSTGKA